jgi:uncharacterized protein YecE (DUF72 family)
VGIDRSYYAPIPETELARYASQLPAGFQTVMKVWNGLTTPVDPRTGEIVGTYLDPEVFEREVLGPVTRGFGGHVGALVFEFAPMRGKALPPARAFAARLDAFFSALPKGQPYAVEIRNRELFTPVYLETLARHGVGHVINFWEAMPDVGHQLRVPGVLTSNVVVTRLLLRPGTRYADRVESMKPFDRITDENPAMRADVEELARMTEALDKELFVIVNNKAEGSSPLTIKALAQRLARP